ncbi:MAG: murein biosynthesis integral membrane protein MurJ, partial [Actinomycetota bacterium]
ANTTPNILYELVVGGVLSAVLLRVYVEVRERSGPEAAWRFVSRVTNAAMIVLGAFMILGLLFAPSIFRLYTALRAPGPNLASQQALGTFLLRLFVPQILFYGFSTISTAILHAHRRFGVPMFVPVLNNLIVTATFLVFAVTVPPLLRSPASVPFSGRLLLGLGTTAGVAAMGLAPWVVMRRVGWRHSWGVGVLDADVRRLGRLAAYTLGYVATNQVGLWITLVLATRVQGGVTAYQTAFNLFQLPFGLFVVSISTVLGLDLAERAVAGDRVGFGRRLIQGLRASIFIVLPAIAGYLAIAPGVVRVLLEHGVATEASTRLIALVLRAWAPGILFFSVFHLLLRSFQALGDTRTPMLVNFGAFAVNIAVNLALFAALADERAKVAGLAVGHAASYLFASVISFRLLSRRLGGFDTRELRRSFALSVLAAAVTGGGAWATARVLERALGGQGFGGQLIPVLVATGVGLGLYASLTRILRLEELGWMRGLARRTL